MSEQETLDEIRVEWVKLLQLQGAPSVADARDLLVHFYMMMNRPELERHKRKMGVEITEESLIRSSRGAIRRVFSDANLSYDRPTREGLLITFEALVRSGHAGAPPGSSSPAAVELKKLLDRVH